MLGPKTPKKLDPNALKVLIVDAYRPFRVLLEQVVTSMGMTVQSSVWSAEMAGRALDRGDVDVVLLDMELPRNGGLMVLQAVQSWNQRHPNRDFTGVIMMSSHSLAGVEAVMSALRDGAFDFVSKPEGLTDTAVKSRMKRELEPRFKHVRRSVRCRRNEKDIPFKARAETTAPTGTAGGGTRFGVILVGASTGGPKALSEFLPALCQVTSLPILLVQHMPPVFTSSMANTLNKRCSHTVEEMCEETVIQSNHVYIAAGGKHMLVDRDAEKRMVVRPGDGPPENSCKPAVDVLFRTAAHYYGRRAVAVVLTGMGHDGALGAAALAGVGAPILVQDRDTSVVWGMPGSVVEAGLPCGIHSLGALPGAVQRVLYN